MSKVDVKCLPYVCIHYASCVLIIEVSAFVVFINTTVLCMDTNCLMKSKNVNAYMLNFKHFLAMR